MLPDFAAQFAPGLLQPDRATPAIVMSTHGASLGKRYNVYRNNVTVSLIQALADIYPAVQRITGEDFFRAMARFHIRATPPTSPMLFDYGRDFPAFIETYPYAQEMPWLADTARIERAWLDAYHAADAPALTAQALASVAEADLADLMLHAHPATRMVCSPYPAVSIFAMNRQPGPVSPLTSSEAQNALVTRPDMEVEVAHLPPEAAHFLTQLMAGQPLGNAAAETFAAFPDFDLSTHLAALIAAGTFVALPTETQP